MTYLEIVNILLQILLLGMAVPVLRRSGPYQWAMKDLGLRMTKPLDCSQCLTFWTSLALHLLFWNTHPLVAVLASLSAGFIAEETEKISERL
jgi:hypothetical protein